MRTISNDLKTVLSSFRFWFCVSMIVITCVANNIGKASYYFGYKMNSIYMFLDGSFLGNSFLIIFYPFMPALACTALWTKNNETLFNIKDKSFIFKRSISTMICSGMIFLIGFGVYMVICLVYNPDIPGITMELNSSLGEYFLYKPWLFSLIFITNTIICGAAYGLFAMGILLNTNSQSMSVIIPGIIYNSADYICWVMPLPVRSVLAWIRPYYTFSLLSAMLPQIVTQLLFIFALSVGLIIIAAAKNPKRPLAWESGL